MINTVPSSKYDRRLARKHLPGKTKPRCDRVLSFAIIPKCIAYAGYAGRQGTGKIGSYNVTSKTSIRWRVWIGLIKIKAGVSAELVTKLAKAFVAQASIYGQ